MTSALKSNKKPILLYSGNIGTIDINEFSYQNLFLTVPTQPSRPPATHEIKHSVGMSVGLRWVAVILRKHTFLFPLFAKPVASLEMEKLHNKERVNAHCFSLLMEIL